VNGLAIEMGPTGYAPLRAEGGLGIIAEQMAEQMPKKPTKKRSPSKRRSTVAGPLDRLREFCLSLPHSTEVESWGAPTFRVGKLFAMYASPTSHHSGGRPAVWIYSIGVEQDLVIRSRPDKYFKPAYVGPYGWIGAWLDRNPPWAEIEELLRDAWRRRAPKKIIPLLDGGAPPEPETRESEKRASARRAKTRR
jgi:hypothetical protein